MFGGSSTNRESGWWVVSYTLFAENSFSFVLFYAIDNFCVWGLSCYAIASIVELDFVRVLGNYTHAEFFRRLLDVIRSPRWSLLNDLGATGASVLVYLPAGRA